MFRYGYSIYKSQAGQVVPDIAHNSISSRRARVSDCVIMYDVTSEVVKQKASQT